jgi:hypothetical protein
MFVAPSPKNATATRASPRSLKESAAPVIAGSPPPTTAFAPEVAALDVVEVHRAAVAVRAALELPVELGHDGIRMRPARERVTVRAVGRGENVAVVHRLADADRDRLLGRSPRAGTRQLAGAEALLDLLLEAPDQEHLAQELAQPFLGEPSFRLDLRHWREFMLSRMALVDQWKVIHGNLTESWTSAHLRLTVEDEPERAAALLAPANAGRHGNVVTFNVGRHGEGSSPDLVTRLLARLGRRADPRGHRAGEGRRGRDGGRFVANGSARRAVGAGTDVPPRGLE